MDDYDGPWKEAIEEWFEEFLAFFFPMAHTLIDWERGYEFLDKELQQLAPQSEQGERTVDKLVKVYLRTGKELWILVHVEVQSQPDRTFPRRMYVYRYRISDKYNRPVISLAVLADEEANWRPTEYREAFAGCELTFRFPTVKLLDLAGREAWLEAEANPFAIVTLAHLKTKETRHDSEERRHWKIRLVKGLYLRGYNAHQVRRLFRILDWLLRLPKEAEKIVWREVERIEKEKAMPYVTSVELIGMERGMEKGMEKGRVEGILDGIQALLDVRFGPAGLQFFPEIQSIRNAEQLNRILIGLKTAATLEEARRLWS